jgi:hypothetical protein
MDKQFEKPLETKKGVIKTRTGVMVVDKTVQFMDAFYKNGGNLTEAALDVFECSSRASAAEMGRKYFEKAQKRGLVASFMENNGINYNTLIQHAYKMMQLSKGPAWWDRLMKEAGYAKQAEEPVNKPAAVAVNVYQAHRSLIDAYVEDGEIVKEEPEDGRDTEEQ